MNSATQTVTQQNEALMRLGILLQLQQRSRRAEEKELPFIFVNETRMLVPYRQAVFWQAGLDGSWKVRAVSGLSTPDSGAPFVLWLESLGKSICAGQQHSKVHALSCASAGESSESWEQWLPPSGLWLPMLKGQKLIGALALFREEAFYEAEQHLLEHLGESYALCLPEQKIGGILPSRFNISIKNWRLWLCALAILLLLFPVRQSVLAPAEVIALQPAHIRASLDGVIKNFFVQPNQKVSIGDKLLGLEDDQLRTRMLVAQKNLEVARAELQQTQQLSLMDSRSKLRLPMVQGRVEQLVAELDLVQSQLERVVISSPAAGVAVLDAPDVWLGRPVSLGQKILEVAAPDRVQLEIRLPMGEGLPLEQGDALLFFPNISPHAPLAAQLSYLAYQAEESPEAGLAFTLRASFLQNEELPRLGLRGTAKLYGERMPIIALLLRKPVLQLRQWLGI